MLLVIFWFDVHPWMYCITEMSRLIISFLFIYLFGPDTQSSPQRSCQKNKRLRRRL